MIRSKISGRFSRLVACALCLVSGVGVLPTAHPQTPSAEQIEMYRNLPPDQQQSIMEQLGVGDGSQSGNGSRTPRADRRLQFPQTVTPRMREDEEKLLDDYAEETD